MTADNTAVMTNATMKIKKIFKKGNLEKKIYIYTYDMKNLYITTNIMDEIPFYNNELSFNNLNVKDFKD